MSAPEYASFLQAIENSGLIRSSELERMRAESAPAVDAKGLARRLVQAGALTKWQALQLLAGRTALTMGPYRLRESRAAAPGELEFEAQRGDAEPVVRLRVLSRSAAAADRNAVEQFFQRAAEEAAQAGAPLVESHRSASPDDRDYVVFLAEPKESPGTARPPGPAATESTAASPPPLRIAARSANSGPLPAAAVGEAAMIQVDTRRKNARRGRGESPQKPAKPALAGGAAESPRAADKGPKPPLNVATIVLAASLLGFLLFVSTLIALSGMLSGGATAVASAGDPLAHGGAAPGPEDSEYPGEAIPATPETADAAHADRQSVAAGAGGTAVAPVAAPATSEGDSTNAKPAASQPSATSLAGPTLPDDGNAAPATSPASEAATADPAANATAAPSAPTPSTESAAADSAGPAPGADDAVAGAASPAMLPAAAESAVAPAGEQAAAEPTGAPPPSPPAQPKPKKRPFAELPALTAIPLPDASNALEPSSFGTVHVPEGELCFVKLRGGETACKGTQDFVLRNADGGLADRDWEVLIKTGDAEPDAKVAHLAIGPGGELTFRWEPGARDQPLSAYLANCPLSFSCDGDSHALLLRKATQVPAMALDLEKKSIFREDWTIDFTPDPEVVRVEILGLEGAKGVVEPASVLTAEGGEATIRIEEGGGLLTLHVETEMRRTLQVSVRPMVRFSADAQPEPLSRRKLQQVTQNLSAQAQQYAAGIPQFQAAAKRLPEAEKRHADGQLARLQQESSQINKALEDAQKLEELLKRLAGQLQLKMRVFAEAGASRVELLSIGSI